MGIDEPHLLTSRKIRGKWWLPTAPNHKVPGDLTFDPVEGLELELMGALAPMVPGPVGDGENEVILGESVTGKYYTLQKCIVTTTNITLLSQMNDPMQTESHHASRMFEGAHFNGQDVELFGSVSEVIQHLDGWLGINPFERFHTNDGERFVVGINYRPPTTMEWKVPALGGCIKIGFTFHSDSGLFEEWRLRHGSYVQIEPDEPKPWEWFADRFHALHNLLIAMMSEPVSPTAISGFLPLQEGERPSQRRRVDYYVSLRDRKARRKYYPDDAFVPFSAVENSFGDIVEKWFSDWPHLRLVYDLYGGVATNHHLFLQVQCLTLTHALEVFHRRTSGGRPSLMTRLERLLDSIGIDCEAFICKERDPYLKLVLGTRNYLTHYDSKGECKAATDLDDLFWLTQSLKLWMTTLLLQRAGVHADILAAAMRDGQWSRRIQKHVPA